MLPTRSNTADAGCSPVSSNCVIWQGPALPCLSLCTGDTVSSVIYKLADFICNSGNQNLDVDLSCLTNVNVTDKSIENILTLLITKTCTLEDLINDIGAGPTVEDPLITIAQCFRTTDSNGDPITTKQHTEYTRLIGLKVCTIDGTVSAHTSTLSSYGNRITVLEQAVLGNSATEGQVTLTCGGTTTTQSISDALLNLQAQVCGIRTALGTNSALTSAAGLQPSSLSTSPALSVTGTMSALTGWKPTVSTVADTISNLWVTLIDLRTAFNNIKDLIKPDCANVIVDFAPAMINNGTAVNLFFSGYSSVPTGWTNTDSKGSKLTITDALGNSHPIYVDVIGVVNSANPLVIQLSGTPLNLATKLTFTLASSLTNSGVQCNKTITKGSDSATNSCPTLTVVPGATTMAFSFAPPINDNAVYKIELLSSGDVVLSTKTFTNPQAIVSDVFTNLLQGTAYKVRATTTIGSLAPVVCPSAPYTTLNTDTGSTTCGLPPTIAGTPTVS